MSNLTLKTGTKDLELPSFPKSKVTVIDQVTYGMLKDINENMQAGEIGSRLLPRIIKAWNFVDEDGNALEVNLENIELLPAEDVKYIMDAVSAESTLKKKTSDA